MRALAVAPHADVIMLDARELDLGSAERFARALRAREAEGEQV